MCSLRDMNAALINPLPKIDLEQTKSVKGPRHKPVKNPDEVKGFIKLHTPLNKQQSTLH